MTSRQHLQQRERRLTHLIAVTHRRAIAAHRLARSLGRLNARRRADLARLQNSQRTTQGVSATIHKGGPDWSNYQGTPNIRRLVDSGRYDVAIRKATEGTGYIDPGFARDWHELRLHPIHRAAYHFCHPAWAAIPQARHFIATVKAAGLAPGDILIADIEVEDSPHVDAWTDAFIAESHRLAPGHDVWLYCSRAWRVWQARGGRLAWVADYNGQRYAGGPEGLQGNVILHQFTDNANVAGINGPCDLSVKP